MISLPAVLTMGEATAAVAQLRTALQAEAAPVIDAAPLQTLDSAALAVLLECERICRAAGKPLQLRGAPAKLVELATLYGVESLLGLQKAA